MNEINDALTVWREGDYINPAALKAAFDAVNLLAAKVAELEKTINILTSKE